jgi:sensor histidine kinase YesM
MTKKILFNIGFWLFLWLTFALSIIRFEPAAQSFRIAALIIFPLVIPVYIHNFIFDYFIIKKRYILYFICTACIVLFFGYIIREFLHYAEPSGSSETYFSLLFMMILYTGARYFRIGTQQRMRIRDEEERRIKAEMELRELEAKQAQAELNMLKSQVNPHFLFNSLNSIYSLILSRSEIAADTVMKLSDLMRYLLESSQKRKVLVKHELDFLQNYIDLEKIRLGKKAKVNCEFNGDLGGKIISPLLLIPFVENCFKHGIGVNPADNVIDISIQVGENILILRTSNNIAPKRIGVASKKTSTGIENVIKRLELLYSKRHQLEIKEDETRFFVNLKIDI